MDAWEERGMTSQRNTATNASALADHGFETGHLGHEVGRVPQASTAGGADLRSGHTERPRPGLSERTAPSSAPGFDVDLPSGGYAWWYVDAQSDCGRYAITTIAFIGSVFSPWYTGAVRDGQRPDPRAHVALNVAIYRLDGGSPTWIMSEHDGRAAPKSADVLTIGASTVTRSGDGLTLEFEDRTSPFPRLISRQLRGTVRVRSRSAQGCAPVSLDDGGRHRWWPVSPRAHVEVDVPSLGLRFAGAGYHDVNQGTEPLSSAFGTWSWGRWHLRSRTVIAYDAFERNGRAHERLLVMDEDGRSVDPPNAFGRSTVGRSRWWLPVGTPHDAGTRPDLTRRLEDAPFYARSLVTTTLFGERSVGVAETLDLHRFDRTLVQRMLPYRSRRTP
jgi:carotenoid 1,2-hydratase